MFKGMKRIGLLAAVAAIMLTISLCSAKTADAQQPPAVFFGKGLRYGDFVEAFIDNKSCGNIIANAAGEWSIRIYDNSACGPKKGAKVSFMVNGKPAKPTDEAVWEPGGLPPDVAYGYVLEVTAPATQRPMECIALSNGEDKPPIAPPVYCVRPHEASLINPASFASTWLIMLIMGIPIGARVYARRDR